MFGKRASGVTMVCSELDFAPADSSGLVSDKPQAVAAAQEKDWDKHEIASADHSSARGQASLQAGQREAEQKGVSRRDVAGHWCR